LLRFAYDALWDRNRRWESNWEERQFETRQQNQAWKHREDAATARGGGRFKNMYVNPGAEEFHQRAAERDYARGRRVLPEQSTATAPSTPSSPAPSDPWAEFDARMRVKEAAAEAELWSKYPEEMARQARERAAATGEPLDPRAQRGLVRRGFAGVEPLKNPNAVEAVPGVDLEGMKRAKIPPTGLGRVGGALGKAGRFAGRAAPWVGAAVAGYGIYRGMEERGGVSLRNAPGAVFDEGVNQVEGLWDSVVPAPTRAVMKWMGFGFGEQIRPRLSGLADPKSASRSSAASAGVTEEEIRAAYSNDNPDERAPSNVGGVPIDYVPTINPNAGQYANAGGWGESAPRAKRGKPFKDLHGIGQARLQAEHEIDQQNEAERRKQREEQQNERKADNYIAYIEKEDRKNERARAASAKRQLAAENSLFWGLQLDAWERERLEGGGRRRHRSITVNSWQAAGATVGGFAQINVELVRSEIERALEKGDAAIRMN
jgi:hypothetical protein